MILYLRTSQYRFVYSFKTGYKLVGTLIGDHSTYRPDIVFNVRSLKAVCLSPQGSLVMGFDDAFGQFKLPDAEVILSGASTETGSFFSINYRDGEACLYDAICDEWVAAGWEPHNWSIEAMTFTTTNPYPRSSLVSSSWADRAIA